MQVVFLVGGHGGKQMHVDGIVPYLLQRGNKDKSGYFQN